jgi:hypothetical protein
MLALLLLLWDAPAPDLRTVRTLDLGKLDWHQARRLEGKRVRVRFDVGSRPHDIDGEILVDAEGEGWPARGVRFARGCAPDSFGPFDTYTVEGVITTRYVPARTIGGQTFAEVWDAMPVHE